MLTNMNPPLAEHIYVMIATAPMKFNIVERDNRHMGYVDNSDRYG